MKTLASIAAIIATAGAAQAAVGTFTITDTASFSEIPDFVGLPLTLDQFDAGSIALAPGETLSLTSIQILAQLTVDGGAGEVDNESGTATTLDVTTGTSLTLSSTDVSLLNSSFQPVIAPVSVTSTQSVSVAADDGDAPNSFDNTGPDFGSVAGPTGTNSDSGFVAMAVWGGGDVGFLGSGTFDVLVDGDTFVTTSAASGVSTATSPQNTSGVVTVIYTYEVVPTPGTAALAGLAGFSAMRRRRA